mmetsp:Transcript_6762/g.7764  ORF Transcript_6762/g.7764 Transcript_6762/m.7764 type:complete len:86 (-) Transcript_6762:53-310(-)
MLKGNCREINIMYKVSLLRTTCSKISLLSGANKPLSQFFQLAATTERLIFTRSYEIRSLLLCSYLGKSEYVEVKVGSSFPPSAVT